MYALPYVSFLDIVLSTKQINVNMFFKKTDIKY